MANAQSKSPTKPSKTDSIKTWPADKPCRLPTAQLIPYARNSRTHSPEQIGQIAASITEWGFTNPILIDAENNIIAGHGRLLAAQKLGLAEVPCIVADGWTEAQKKAYVIADNKLALNAGWDTNLLGLELAELDGLGFDASLLGFSAAELAALSPIKADGLTNEDAVPETPSEPITVLGDVWLLGNHRLMCGDSTSIDAVEKLMDGQKADMVFTDPPYGVSAGGGRSQTVKQKNIRAIENDELRGAALKQFIADALGVVPLKLCGSFYVCYDQKTQHEFTGVLREIGWKQRNTIIWNKNNFGLSGHKGYRPKFELIAFGHTGESYEWHGDNSQADVWDIARPSERPGNHPTPKPVNLVERAVANSSKKNDIVVDVFGGSGSTLIACEKTSRHARLMELDPKYCDVIIKRWQDFTGKKAIHAETGKEFANDERS